MTIECRHRVVWLQGRAREGEGGGGEGENDKGRGGARENNLQS